MTNHRHLKQCKGTELEFLDQPAEWVFSKGACHAFAYELYEFFEAAEVDSQIVILCDQGVDRYFATHALVCAKGRCWDITGADAVDNILQHWAKETGRPQKKVEIGCKTLLVSCDTRPDSDVCYESSIYDHYCETKFMRAARGKAKKFIREVYASKFLPEELKRVERAE